MKLLFKFILCFVIHTRFIVAVAAEKCPLITQPSCCRSLRIVSPFFSHAVIDSFCRQYFLLNESDKKIVLSRIYEVLHHLNLDTLCKAAQVHETMGRLLKAAELSKRG